MSRLYPSDTSHSVRTFPIQRYASQAMLSPAVVHMDPEARYPLAYAIFDAKMKLIHQAAGAGQLIVPDSMDVSVAVRVMARTVPAEAGQLGAEAAMRGGMAVQVYDYHATESPLWQ